MPVIILGSSGSLPIDPDFDDGGIVQNVGTVLDNSIGIVDSPTVSINGTSVSVGSIGSSTFLDDPTPTIITGSVITNTGGFFMDVVPSIPATPTPNIIATPIPTPSTPDGGPTVNDFSDDGVVQIVGTAVETGAGGFISNDPITDTTTSVSSIQVGSNVFTQGDVTNGTAPAPSADTTTVVGFGLIAPPTIPVAKTFVVS